VDVYYAGKAFLCTTVARWIADEGLGLDVCTGGELAVAIAAGFPAERIALHGNNKSLAELSRAVDAHIGHVIVDSFDEIARLADVAAAAGIRQRVLVRVTVGVEAHTHEFIATAHEDQKFGFSLRDGSAAQAVAAVLAAPSLELAGLHSHIGSQIFETAGFEVAAHRVVGLAATIRDVHGVQIDEINLGGGLGIAYVAGDDPESPKQTLERLSGIVEIECASVGLRTPRLSVEPGRAIVGPSAITVYEVGTVKDVTLDGGHTRRYVSVDGGMSDNIRTALYDADYTCVLASRQSSRPAALSRVVGKHCESGDVVVRDTWLPGDVRPGDLVAVAATGAYCRSMASNYNHVPRPPVVSVCDGIAQVIVRRETEDDLLRLDMGVDR
jgi:diaminopimelate decarboxylase